WFTRRQAEAWLDDVLRAARRGTLPGQVRCGVKFSEAAEEWLRFIREDRGRKPSTLVDYQSALRAHVLPAFGYRELEMSKAIAQPLAVETGSAVLQARPAIGDDVALCCNAWPSGKRRCATGRSRDQPSGGIRRRFVPSARAERRLKMMEG
ncbi:MAG: hypothetical protein ACXWQR_24780, partial [Ktedonobacterales bacterium]